MATVSIIYMHRMSKKQDEELKEMEFVDINAVSKDKILDTVIKTLNPNGSTTEHRDSLYANVANSHKASLIL